MTYQVRFEKRAQKTLKKMDRHQAGIIMAWIKKNLIGTTNPKEYGKGLTAYRIGEWRYRIISHTDDETIIILILEIGHRRDVYK